MSGEGICQLCGRDYPVWFAPSDIWNEVQRGGDPGAADEESFLCPLCFVVKAEAHGVVTHGWAVFTGEQVDALGYDPVTWPRKLERVVPRGNR